MKRFSLAIMAGIFLCSTCFGTDVKPKDEKQRKDTRKFVIKLVLCMTKVADNDTVASFFEGLTLNDVIKSFVAGDLLNKTTNETVFNVTDQLLSKLIQDSEHTKCLNDEKTSQSAHSYPATGKVQVRPYLDLLNDCTRLKAGDPNYLRIYKEIAKEGTKLMGGTQTSDTSGRLTRAVVELLLQMVAEPNGCFIRFLYNTEKVFKCIGQHSINYGNVWALLGNLVKHLTAGHPLTEETKLGVHGFFGTLSYTLSKDPLTLDCLGAIIPIQSLNLSIPQGGVDDSGIYPREVKIMILCMLSKTGKSGFRNLFEAVERKCKNYIERGEIDSENPLHLDYVAIFENILVEQNSCFSGFLRTTTKKPLITTEKASNTTKKPSGTSRQK